MGTIDPEYKGHKKKYVKQVLKKATGDYGDDFTTQGTVSHKCQVHTPLAEFGDFRMWSKNLQHFAHMPLGVNNKSTRCALIYSIWWLQPTTRVTRRLIEGENLNQT